MDYTVFYAWQSDTERKLNRFLIRDATQDAIDRITTDAKLEDSPRLDHDTKDTPGMPDVANVIFEKIERCGIFLVDVTIAAKLPPKEPNRIPKGIPNPNAMLELGYAAASIGWPSIIAVMNTAYGEPEILPFDLTHRRWPITYNAPTDIQDLKTVKKKLSEDIETALRTAIQAGVIHRRPIGTDERLAALEKAMQQSLDGQTAIQETIRQVTTTVQTAIHAVKEDNAPKIMPEEAYRKEVIERLSKDTQSKFDQEKGFLLLTIVPPKAAQPSLDLTKYTESLPRGMQPIEASGWDYYPTGHTFCTFAKNPNTNTPYSIVEITDAGAMAAANSEVIRIDPSYLEAKPPSDGVTYIPSVAFEKLTMEACHRYLELLKQLGQTAPWYVNVCLIGLGPSILYISPRYGGGRSNKPFKGGNITPEPLLIETTTPTESKQNVAKAMRPIFDFIWREFGFARSINYDSNGQWVGQE